MRDQAAVLYPPINWTLADVCADADEIVCGFFLTAPHLESSCVCVIVNGMQEAGLELLEILMGKFVRHSVSFIYDVGSIGSALSDHQKSWF
jgi:hypothetical protein